MAELTIEMVWGIGGVIFDEGYQWMITENEILHQEMPKVAEWILGFQL
ncbi:MAG: hypothetical protein LBH34_04305 [Prevotellaceae bacterium]|jgi:hypothetical protein|nr:hypothetical protein [Prevotellaceae bacterium]